ncbi:mitochondrial ribosomal small subunit component [Lunasporangiospora selenospora]|uniref:Small ribosomal subunit protein mS23 n=1 Tax=Lunasporangiospora selenospora TaxID=979761 RepID=A0A9P6KFU0_9FUNG|nr:mitochondrial ribosomal small subunit component [Lunasporangiospora selenospora]
MAPRTSPAKIHGYVTKLIKASLIKRPPVWYAATTLAPPSPTFLRERDPSSKATGAAHPFEAKAAKASGAAESTITSKELTRSARSQKHLRWKSERPKLIVYPEDRLRRRFYEDHPWELRRPRCLVESTGDGTRHDWSSLLQKGRSIADLTGEDVIRYQLYLISTGKSEREAYSTATSEFYLYRAQEETEARAAKAQAMAFGLQPRRSFVMNGLKREEEALREAERLASKF